MNELDVGSPVVEYLAIVHNFGEAAIDGIERWISASFAMVLLRCFAPERLRLGVTSMIVSLYSMFSIWSISNAIRDINLSGGVIRDVREIDTVHELELELNAIAAYDVPIAGAFMLAIFIIGLFLATNGFLIACCVKNLRSKHSKSTADS